MPLKMKLKSTDLIIKDSSQLAQLDIENTGKPQPLILVYRIDKEERSKKVDLPRGSSTLWLDFPAVKTARELRVEAKGKGKSAKARIQPHRKWSIHLVNHTHTDLGYTDLPHNLDKDFYRYLLEVMTLVRKTRDFPPAARFRWTNECAFHLQNFLRFATPSQVNELIPLLKKGTIDSTALFLQMTDLPDADQIVRSMRFLRSFARRHRIPLYSAMACDINGLPWIYPAALHDLGVRNLSMAINHDMARRPLDPPMPFWWESTDGKRILVWHGEIYQLGNRYDVEEGVEKCMAGLMGHLEGLAGQGYPFEHVLMLMSGSKRDCAPPTIGPSLTCRDWIDRFENPSMRMATLSDWFVQLREILPKKTPVYRGHWPDYWAHGLGSAADEMRFAREAQHLIRAAGAAHSYVSLTEPAMSNPTRALNEAGLEVDLALEHTFGASCSVTRPYHDFSKLQWQHKRERFYRSWRESDAILKDGLEQMGRSAIKGLPAVVVYNPLPWSRNGAAELVPAECPRAGHRVDSLVDMTSKRNVHYLREGIGSVLAELTIPVEEVPATGFKVLPVLTNVPPLRLDWKSRKGKQNVLENSFYRIRIQPQYGGIESIYDKELKRELVKKNRTLPFGRIIGEQLSKPEAREWANHEDRVKLFKKGVFKRALNTAKNMKRVDLEGVFQQIAFYGTCRGLDGLSCVVRLYEGEKRIDFTWRLMLPARTDPSAGYVPFSFAGQKPKAWLEVPGGAMEPGRDQIPTTCYDFYTVQNFVRIETGNGAITLVPRDTPLVQLNEISTFRFREKLPPFNGTVVAWLFNNYWTTNFPATQPGEHPFRFSLTSGRAKTHDMAASYRFAYEVTNPLRAHFLPESCMEPPKHWKSREVAGSFVSVEPKNVILIGTSPAAKGKGCLFRLQEIAGKRTRCTLRFEELRPRTAHMTDLFGGSREPAGLRGSMVQVTLGPREMAGVRVVF